MPLAPERESLAVGDETRATMSMRHAFPCVALLAGLLLGCGVQKQPAASADAQHRERPPVVVQGAMPIETDALVRRLDAVSVETVGGWTFWRGQLDAYPVVVSRTRKGVSNVAAATTIAVERYHPSAIINQGTAGGHDPELRVSDIVLGRHSLNLGAFKTGYRERGQGSNTLEWNPLDLLASEGSAAHDPAARQMRRFDADEHLLAAARSVRHLYGKGRVVEGVIGSSDAWNSELDRIDQLHREYETSVEEMETASAAQIAGAFKIPFLGIRVLSNNITNGGTYDGTTGEACQEYVYHVVRAYIAATLKSRAGSVTANTAGGP